MIGGISEGEILDKGMKTSIIFIIDNFSFEANDGWLDNKSRLADKTIDNFSEILISDKSL